MTAGGTTQQQQLQQSAAAGSSDEQWADMPAAVPAAEESDDESHVEDTDAVYLGTRARQQEALPPGTKVRGLASMIEMWITAMHYRAALCEPLPCDAHVDAMDFDRHGKPKRVVKREAMTSARSDGGLSRWPRV